MAPIAVAVAIATVFIANAAAAVDIGIAGAAKEVGKELRQKVLDRIPGEDAPQLAFLISTVVATGIGGYNGDGILATSAQLAFPRGLFVDSEGCIYIADSYNQRIRKLTPQ